MPAGAWAIAVNQPSVGRRVAGVTRSRAVVAALKMMTTATMLPGPPRFATSDPFHHLHPEVFRAPDQLVASGRIEMVGVNYYPHRAVEPLHYVRRVLAERWKLPLMIPETGWHQALRARIAAFLLSVIAGTGLAHVRADVSRADVDVRGICWYPWLDMPDWQDPQRGRCPAAGPDLRPEQGPGHQRASRRGHSPSRKCHRRFDGATEPTCSSPLESRAPVESDDGTAEQDAMDRQPSGLSAAGTSVSSTR